MCSSKLEVLWYEFLVWPGGDSALELTQGHKIVTRRKAKDRVDQLQHLKGHGLMVILLEIKTYAWHSKVL